MFATGVGFGFLGGVRFLVWGLRVFVFYAIWLVWVWVYGCLGFRVCCGGWCNIVL